ncbi:mucin-15 isoform X2 [Oryzias latipes]|uniref:Uncharacterized protein n=2 Tax=Oryzias latipes TaxID=8090 RepID=A0A3B3HUD4_ORYLA|nr:mucin-15 isoform X2 [Oryzias latipes]
MQSLKIVAGLLLFAQAFHPALFQDSTDSPGRTIDPSWLRDQKLNPLVTKENDYDQGTEIPDLNNDFSSGVPSGSLAVSNEEEENLARQIRNDTELPNEQSNKTVSLQLEFDNDTSVEPEFSDANISNSSQTNSTQPTDVLNATANPENATRAGDFSNSTKIQSTTSAPENNTTAPDVNKGLRNSTGSNTTVQSTTAPNPQNSTGTNSKTAVTTAAQETDRISTASPFTTVQLFENPERSTESSSTAAPNTVEKTNRTFAGGSGRGLELDPYRSRRSVAWLAVLGTVAAVAVVGFVAYSIMKKRQQKAFSHRKLVEEFPSEPVLRLDNGDPLDLRRGGPAYYNSGLQGDEIQMTNIPSRR